MHGTLKILAETLHSVSCKELMPSQPTNSTRTCKVPFYTVKFFCEAWAHHGNFCVEVFSHNITSQ